MPLVLTPHKPVIDTEGDAAQIANGFTTIENYCNGNFEPAGIKQSGAAVGQVMMWDGAKWAPGNIPTPVVNPVWTFQPVSVATNNALTPIVTQVIPGGTLGATKRVRIAIYGTYFNNNAASPFRVQVSYGGVAFWDAISANTQTSAVSQACHVLADLMASTDAAHQALGGFLFFGTIIPGAPTTGVGAMQPSSAPTAIPSPFASAGPLAVNSAVDQPLVVSVKHTNANALIQYNMLGATVQVVG